MHIQKTLLKNTACQKNIFGMLYAVEKGTEFHFLANFAVPRQNIFRIEQNKVL